MTAISIDNPVKNAVSPEPKYFDGLPVTGKQRRIVFLLAFGFFFDFMDNSNFGVVAPAILKLWHLSLQQIGWINSAFFIGMFIGGISGGHLSNVFGRKKVLLASIAFFSVFSLFNGLAPGFITFLLARLLTGIGTASLVVVTNLYLIEMLPGESRGRWQALVFALGVLGIPILGLLNKIIIPSGPEAWRVLIFWVGAGFLAFFAGLIWLRESPRWLVSKGRIAEAELILGDITGLDIRLNPSTSVPEKAFGLVYTIRSLTGQANLRRTIVLTSIFWVGYPAYAILGWLPTLFSKKGFSLDETASFSICLALGLTAASFVASLISDLGGRKWSIITLFLSAGILSLLYGHLESKYLIFGFVILFSLVVQALNPITSTYLAELYPTPIRGLAVGLIYSIGRIAIAFVQLLIAPISERFGDVGVFTFTAVLFAVPAAITALWGERTSGRSLENLAS